MTTATLTLTAWVARYVLAGWLHMVPELVAYARALEESVGNDDQIDANLLDEVTQQAGYVLLHTLDTLDVNGAYEVVMRAADKATVYVIDDANSRLEALYDKAKDDHPHITAARLLYVTEIAVTISAMRAVQAAVQRELARSGETAPEWALEAVARAAAWEHIQRGW